MVSLPLSLCVSLSSSPLSCQVRMELESYTVHTARQHVNKFRSVSSLVSSTYIRIRTPSSDWLVRVCSCRLSPPRTCCNAARSFR